MCAYNYLTVAGRAETRTCLFIPYWDEGRRGGSPGLRYRVLAIYLLYSQLPLIRYSGLYDKTSRMNYFTYKSLALPIFAIFYKNLLKYCYSESIVGIYSQSALLPRRNHAGQHAQANAATHSDVG